MKNKSWLWIILVLLVAIFLWLYFKPAAPSAPVATVWQVVNTPKVDTVENNEEVVGDDINQEAWEEVGDTEVEENEGEVDVVLPDSPLADIQEIDSFEDTIGWKGLPYALIAGSQVEWLGKKVWGQHNGVVEISKGEMYVEAGQIIEGRFTMDMTSIKATDVDDEGLDDHLKEWFNTAEYPTAEFLLNEATTNSVSGIMTINGQSREISFPATVIVEDDTVIANADFALDRTQWGVDGWTPAISQYMELSFNLTWLAE